MYVFGRSDEKVNLLKEKLARHQIRVINQHSIKEACLNADLITSVTPSTTPLIDVSWLNQKVHINAFGSDTKGKRELSLNILETADLILCDSLKQCLTQGELQYLNEINNYPVPIELGEFLINDYEQINGLSVCDFTGVAIQDIKLSEAIFNKLSYEDN